MALFKQGNNSLSRAQSILSTLSGDGEGKDLDTPPADGDNTPPVDGDSTPPADGDNTPPADGDNTPPADDDNTPPADGDNTPPADDDNTPPAGDDDVPPEGPGQSTPPVEVTDDLILKHLSDKLGREVQSFDDLKPTQVELDEEVQQLLEWKEKTGLSLTKWPEYSKDYSKMTDVEVAREVLVQDYELNEEELTYAMRDYVFDEEQDDPQDRFKKSVALKKLAKDGREKLEARKVQLMESQKSGPALTEEQQKLLEEGQKYVQSQQSAQAAQQEYLGSITQAANALENIDLNLDEGVELKYNLPEDVRKAVPKTILEMPHWFNEDGTYNHKKVVEDVIKATHFEKMVKAAYEQGVSVGREKQIRSADPKSYGSGGPQEKIQKDSTSNIDEVLTKLAGPSRKARFGKK